MKNIEQLFELKKARFKRNLGSKTVKTRLSYLTRLRKWIIDHKDQICAALEKDLGKPHEESMLTDVWATSNEVKHLTRNLRQWSRSKKVPGTVALLTTRARYYYEPKGVVAVVAPWNYPFLLTVGPLATAIAAGNSVFVKPSEHTPHVSNLISEMVEEIFDSDHVSVHQGGVEMANSILSLPLNHIFFTGSPAVGKKVMKKASKQLIPVTLELGGQNPVLVHESANIEDTAKKICWGKFTNSGQTCIAPNFVLVHSSIRKELFSALVREARKMYSGPGSYSNVVNQHHLERLNYIQYRLIEESEHFERIHVSNNSPLTFEPLIIKLNGVHPIVTSEEIFGPILPIIEYENIDEAFEVIRSTGTPLAAYIFSRKNSLIKDFSRRVEAGTIGVNETTLQFVHPHLPFGGKGESGIGRSHGEEGFKAFSNVKSVLRNRRGWTTLKMVMPPYTGFKKWAIKVLTKYF